MENTRIVLQVALIWKTDYDIENWFIWLGSLERVKI